MLLSLLVKFLANCSSLGRNRYFLFIIVEVADNFVQMCNFRLLSYDAFSRCTLILVFMLVYLFFSEYHFLIVFSRFVIKPIPEDVKALSNAALPQNYQFVLKTFAAVKICAVV